MYMNKVLHIVRNPHGWSEEEQRLARLALADAYEKLVNPHDVHNDQTWSYPVVIVPGLKNHHIAQLVSAVANELHARWALPEMLRQVVSGVVCTFLRQSNLMLDSSTKQYKGKEGYGCDQTTKEVPHNDAGGGYDNG